jgi:hypothetical protein
LTSKNYTDNDKIDSSREIGKNFITWAWPASTKIIYDNPVDTFTNVSVTIFQNLVCALVSRSIANVKRSNKSDFHDFFQFDNSLEIFVENLQYISLNPW